MKECLIERDEGPRSCAYHHRDLKTSRKEAIQVTVYAGSSKGHTFNLSVLSKCSNTLCTIRLLRQMSSFVRYVVVLKAQAFELETFPLILFLANAQ